MKRLFLHQGGCKKWIIPTVIASVGFLIAGFVLAYDSHNAHRALTYEAVEFYNLSTPSGSPSKEGERITSEEIEWMMDGAQAEDTPPRWINHFYNPATGQGWTGEGNGGIPSDALKLISKLALSSRDPISAKNWAKNRSAQSDYAYYEGDQTWQEAIDAYLQGDKQKALEALGHILHLLEDMTVPDHTRNDTHAGLAGDKGSPYENWAKNYTAGKEKSLGIASALYQAGQKPKQFPIIENYFDYNANYSSKNFFSEDTIFGDYPILSKSENFSLNNLPAKKLYTNDVGGNYLAALIFLDANNNIIKTINDNEILNNYWQRLSRQAVISGAGAINLFFQDVEQQKKLNPNPAPRQTSNSKIFSPFGELAKITNAINNFVLGAKTIAAEILPSSATTVDINELNPPQPENNDIANNEIASSPTAPRNDTSGDRTPDTNVGTIGSPVATNRPTTTPANDADTSRDTATVEHLYISRVIDGDTVTLNNGKDARLIGINSPEYGEKCFEEAKRNLENLILGKYITLEKDTSETDKYDRLLRYIYLDGVMINAEMIKNGFARVMTVPPDTKYADAFRLLEDEAKFFHRGCLYKSPSSLLPLIKGEDGGSADDKGPYYGGSSYAGGAGPEHRPPSPLKEEETSSTPENSATSTPEIPPIITPTSTPNAATSTPPAPEPPPPETPTSTPPESEPEPQPAQDKILISEVQVKGATADDEFVELYNPNNLAVSLNGWSLQYRGSESKNFSKKNFEKGAAVPAYGFYLIAHNNYSGGTVPDMAHGSIKLSADGGTIFLVKDKKYLETGDESIISDKVAYLAGEKSSSTALFAETAEFSTTSTFASFERKSNASSTAETMAAGGINEKDGNAYDTDNNLNDFILRAASDPQNASSTPEDPTNQHYPPEPKPEPPPPPPPPPPEPLVVCVAPTYDGHKNYEGKADWSNALPFPQISGNSTVTLSSGQTYYVRSSSVPPKVPATSRLIIPEGVVIKFGPWEQGGWGFVAPVIIIEGDLEINGTKNNPVIFTSFRDDAHGAPMNMTTSTPAPDDWGYVEIDSRKGKNIKIQNAGFYYGGSNAALLLNGDADMDISDSEFKYNQSGIYASFYRYAGNVSISNSNFEYNALLGARFNDIPNVSANVIGNSFKCNGFGRGNTAVSALYIATIEMWKKGGGAFTINNNNFWGDGEPGLKYNSGYNSPGKKDNIFLTAVNNYWGDPSGPFHAAANPAGQGNAVSDNVIFFPFLPSAYSNSW